MIAGGLALSLAIAPLLARDGAGPGLSVAAADTSVVEQSLGGPTNIAGLVDDAASMIEASTTTLPTTTTLAPTTTEAPSTTVAPEPATRASTTEAPTTTVAPVAEAAPTTAAPTTAAPTTTAAPPPTAPPTTAAPAPQVASSGGGDFAYSDPRGTQVWDDMAKCESGGNWSINTGNGYYGGLQFSLGSWERVGGTGYPHEASRETQIEMGRRLQARQGWGAWPSCSSKLGLR